MNTFSEVERILIELKTLTTFCNVRPRMYLNKRIAFWYFCYG